jgi:hypothetical protein
MITTAMRTSYPTTELVLSSTKTRGLSKYCHKTTLLKSMMIIRVLKCRAVYPGFRISSEYDS